ASGFRRGGRGAEGERRWKARLTTLATAPTTRSTSAMPKRRRGGGRAAVVGAVGMVLGGGRRLTVATVLALEGFANFYAECLRAESPTPDAKKESAVPAPPDLAAHRAPVSSDEVKFAVSYTINLNLPETTNPEVFNAIFRALRDNLLSSR